MTFSTEIFDREAAGVRAFAGRELEALSRDEFAALREAVGRARRSLDSVVAAVAAETARRSAPDLGAQGIARTAGHSQPQGLVAADLGLSNAEATRLIKVGTSMREAQQPPEDRVDSPPTYPHVAVAVEHGRISIEAADIITRTLEAIDPADPQAGDLGELEQRLVASAQRMTLADLRKSCRRQEAFRAPRSLAAKERRLRRERYLSFSEDAMGMTVMHAKMDPASAAPIRAWVDAQVRDAMRRRRDEPGGDEREPGQMRIDALAMLAQHGLDCDQPTSGVKTQVVVRVSAGDLEAGEGVAECDQLSGPISVATLRAMAVDAEVVPVVLGGASLPLDVGRASRYFTPAQRIALAERDGGCSWCHAPPSYCEAHHIRWWGRDRGPSDLDNGVLLCTSCHHRIHEQQWSIDVRDGEVWFTPPRSVDREQRPRLGGKAHLDLLESPPLLPVPV